jgi:hypothetical protein
VVSEELSGNFGAQVCPALRLPPDLLPCPPPTFPAVIQFIDSRIAAYEEALGGSGTAGGTPTSDLRTMARTGASLRLERYSSSGIVTLVC